jgi:cytochrome c biogenesis protein CcmG/thiol:disulfide interchange protein DsbE
MDWRRSLVGLGIALPLVGLLAFGLTRDPSEIVSPLPGRPAPDFAMKVMDADTVIRLSNLRGQVVVVNFWASWCIPCLQEHPQLMAAKRRWEGQGVQLLGVLYDDSESNARRWLEQFGGAEWPTLLDPQKRMAIDYGTYGVPETFIIDQAGNVVHKQLSIVTLDTLAHFIEPLLAKGTQ